MKKLLFTVVTVCGLWIGTLSMQMNSVSAQTSTLTGMLTPLTNHLATTNTLVLTTNLSHLQLNDVLTLLLKLQTNVEETLPVLDMVESNVTLVNLPATNGPSQSPLSLSIGTNTFAIDPPTLEAIAVLRDDLQRTLPVLQALNGTVPAPSNTVVGAATLGATAGGPPASFAPAPLTGALTPPFTNETTPLTNSPDTVVTNAPGTPLTNAFTPLTNVVTAPVTNFAAPPLTNAFNAPLANVPLPFTNVLPPLSPGAISPF